MKIAADCIYASRGKTIFVYKCKFLFNFQKKSLLARQLDKKAFIKGTQTLCMKCVRHMKTCLKIKDSLDFNVLESFSLHEHVLQQYYQKKEKAISFACIHKHFCCIYEIVGNNNILPNHPSFLYIAREICLAWFLLVFCLKERCTHELILSKKTMPQICQLQVK